MVDRGYRLTQLAERNSDVGQASTSVVDDAEATGATSTSDTAVMTIATNAEAKRVPIVEPQTVVFIVTGQASVSDPVTAWLRRKQLDERAFLLRHL